MDLREVVSEKNLIEQFGIMSISSFFSIPGIVS
jgi:hypothetical protein